jgi:hypothetical protein
MLVSLGLQAAQVAVFESMAVISRRRKVKAQPKAYTSQRAGEGTQTPNHAVYKVPAQRPETYAYA